MKTLRNIPSPIQMYRLYFSTFSIIGAALPLQSMIGNVVGYTLFESILANSDKVQQNSHRQIGEGRDYQNKNIRVHGYLYF